MAARFEQNWFACVGENLVRAGEDPMAARFEQNWFACVGEYLVRAGEDLMAVLWMVGTASRDRTAPAGWRRVVDRSIATAWTDSSRPAS